MVRKHSAGVREGAAVPCCAHCGVRPWTDWRPDYQKYLCEKCFVEAPPSLYTILTSRRGRRNRVRGGRKEAPAYVENALDFAGDE